MRPSGIFALLLSALVVLDAHPKYLRAATLDPPRGLVTMALLNPRFPVKKAADILSASPNPAFAFIYKSFGARYENLQALLDSLLNNPTRSYNNVTAIVYLDCGPCRFPRRPRGIFRLIAPGETISSLNKKLERANHKTLTQFEKALSDLNSKLPVRPGVNYILQVGLEDNYTPHAHRVLRVLARSVFLHREDVAVGRNPAVRYNGKNYTYPVERHSCRSSALRQLKTGDILTGDGFHMRLQNDRCVPELSFSQESIRRLIIEGADKGVTVLLWRPEHQGINPCSPQSVFIPPHKRRYKISNVQTFKDLLRR